MRFVPNLFLSTSCEICYDDASCTLNPIS